VRSGPILIGYDGTEASDHALRGAAELLRGRRALVVVVWKSGLAFELIELPASSIGLPPAPIDIRTALEAEHSVYEGAERAARRATAMARELGLEAEPLVVAEDPEIAVDETLVRLARERDSQVVVVGAHAHGPILGSVSRGVVRHAPCPALVVRDTATDGRRGTRCARAKPRQPPPRPVPRTEATAA
jgi:nucleotide-binding universal stress UspA family protein